MTAILIAEVRRGNFIAVERYAPRFMRGQGARGVRLSGCFGMVLMLAAPLFVVWAVRDVKPSRDRQAQAVTASAAITRVVKIYTSQGLARVRPEERFAKFRYGYEYDFSVDGHTYFGEFTEHKDVVTHSVDEIIPISYLRSDPADNNLRRNFGAGSPFTGGRPLCWQR